MGVEKDVKPGEGEQVVQRSHWVVELFSPRFTMLDLLKDRRHSSGAPQLESSSLPMLPSETMTMARASRKQAIYWAALEEMQQREEQWRKRERLAKRMLRKEEEEREMDHRDVEHSSMASRHAPGEEKGAGHVWNEQDLAALRWGVREVERDRRRLSAQLQHALVRVEEERTERRRLQELLEEREAQLAHSRSEGARQSQRLDALLAQCRNREGRAEAWAAEARGQAEEAGRARERLRRAEEEARDLRAGKKELAREADALKRQLDVQRQGREAAVRAEQEAALQGVRQELELVQAELEAERQRHVRSRMALELLRRHCNSQSEQQEQRHADEVTYM